MIIYAVMLHCTIEKLEILHRTKKPRGLLRAVACAPGPEDDIRRARYLNMLISLEGAHVFWMSIFGGVEHKGGSARIGR